MLHQEAAELFVECAAAMIFRLLTHIFHNRIEIGCADAESAVSLLPREEMARLVDLFRRLRLEDAHCDGHSNLRWHADEQMNVISRRANLNEIDPILNCNSAQSFTQFDFNRRLDQLA